MPDIALSTVLLIAGLAALVSWSATPLMRFIAVNAALFDMPDRRKVHATPTPLLGGGALYVGFLAGVGVIVFIPFVFTLNRTSYVALLGGLAFIAYVEKSRKWLVFMLISLLLSSYFWTPHSVRERIAFTWEDSVHPGRYMGVDSSLQGRVRSFIKMWDCVRHGLNPVFGCGVGSTDNPDSQYARTLYEMGFLGFGLWAWVFIRLFRMSRWLFCSLEDGGLKGLALGYRAGLIGILLHGLGTITLYTVRIMEPFWFVTGLIVSLYLIRISEESTVAYAKGP